MHSEEISLSLFHRLRGADGLATWAVQGASVPPGDLGLWRGRRFGSAGILPYRSRMQALTALGALAAPGERADGWALDGGPRCTHHVA